MYKIIIQKYKLLIPTSVILVAATIIGVGLSYDGPASAANSSNVNFAATVQPSVNISLASSTVSLNLNPGITPFATQSTTITASTNSTTGYSLYLTSNSNVLTRTEALSDTTYPTISTLATKSGGYTENEFRALSGNYWGWNVNNGNYYPFSTPTKVYENAGMAASDTVNLGFGAIVDYTQAAGTYNSTFNLVALANSNPIVMQTMTVSDCPTANTTLAYDIRDGNAYTIQKLADGRCWMLDNLALDLTAVSLETLQGNTNAENATLGYLKNGGGTSPYTATSVNTSWPGSHVYSLPKINIQSIDIIPNNSSYGNGNHKVGIYYSYCAATAGSYCYASSYSSGNANQDICPTGWRMPTGGASGEYQALYAAYSSNATNFKTALSVPVSGYYDYRNATYHQGNYGIFWSSVRYSNAAMYRLYVDDSNVDPQSYNDRTYGLPVRCILE